MKVKQHMSMCHNLEHLQMEVEQVSFSLDYACEQKVMLSNFAIDSYRVVNPGDLLENSVNSLDHLRLGSLIDDGTTESCT